MILPERGHTAYILAECLDRARGGEGGVAVVDGPVAVGKSTLLAAFAEQAAAADVLTLTAIASEPESSIPLGVVGQLLATAALPAPEREWVDRLVATGTAHMSAHEARPAKLSAIDAQIVDSLCGVVLGLADQRPVAITVDDVHHADTPSLSFLAYLARRVRNASVLAVFGHADPPAQHAAGFLADLVRQPHSRSIHLRPLSQEGVHLVVADRLGPAEADRIAELCLGLTGGNPLLLHGLLDDAEATADPAAGGRPPLEPAADLPADGYGRAVVACLRRSPAPVARTAQALAVTGSPQAVPRLLGVQAGVVERHLRALQAAGLLRDGGFRHPAARTAVLAGLDAGTLADLHRRAAELDYADGREAPLVAGHLLAGRHTAVPWAADVLAGAAEELIADGRPGEAVDYLRLACDACDDEAELARLRTALLRAERRVNPNVPEQRIAGLLAAMHAGWLGGTETIFLARALLRLGQFDAARRVLERLGTTDPAGDPETASEIRTLRLWIRSTYPSLCSCLPPDAKAADDRRALPTTTATGRRHSAVLALDLAVTQGPSERAAQKADRVLAGARPESAGVQTVESALLALVYAEQAATAARHCDDLLAMASGREEPSRTAMLLAIRSEICARLGDLPGAKRNATAAFEIVPAQNWGVAVGGPLAAMLIATTAMGRYDEAADLLNVPTPETMFQTRYGLLYLYARGRYELATGDAESALSDFLSCGDLMIRWQIDSPALIGWRAEAAEAWLRMDEPAKARSAVEDQLARCDRERSPRTHGSTLRSFASTVEPRRRPALLRQAVDLLQDSGDRYELARALAALADLYHGLGETRRARVIGRQAWTIADQCGAAPLSKLLAADSGRFEPEPESPAALLSDAEQRVADLVALGHTNREIARRLSITVSTVEQHLTRIYRKVGVSGRANLASMLSGGTALAQGLLRHRADAALGMSSAGC